MDLDNEPVDWGFGDDDSQQPSRKASYDHVGQEERNDADEIEDTVSLGEDEDYQGYFYPQQDASTETKIQNDGNAEKDSPARPESEQARDNSMGANNLSRSRYHSKEDDRTDRSRGRDRRMSLESPPRQRSSNRHSSPQRSQQGPARMTHALPPKPTQVFYIPPSHSSKVEAVGMTSISPPSRSTIRDGKKTNGAPTKLDALPDVDHWEKRYSWQGGEPPHHGHEIPESTRNNPVSNLPSTSSLETSLGRRRSASSSGNMALIRNSNTSHSQTSHSNRERPYSRLEKDREDSIKAPSATVDGFLSHDDRHYVPSSAPDIRVTERTEGVNIAPKSRYERSPAGSPRQRRRPRSISPSHDDPRGSKFPPRDKGYDSLRGSGRLRGRDGYTTTNDSDIPREAPIVSHDSDRHWAASSRGPPADFSRNERVPRRQNDRQTSEDYAYEQRSVDDRNRPPFKSMDSRGPNREREAVRPSERAGRRERPNDNEDFIPSPRYRSPPHARERDLGREYANRQSAMDYTASASSGYRGSSRPEYPSEINGPPSLSHEPLHSRPRDYERPQEPSASRHDERDYQRRRREPSPDSANLPRIPSIYPEDQTDPRFQERNIQIATTKRDRSPVETSSLRKRQPLPPQTKTFLFASGSGPSHKREPPPHIAPVALAGRADIDPNIPRAPRVRDEDGPRDRQAVRDRQGGRKQSPSSRPPPIDTRMDIDQDDRLRSSNRPSPYDQRGSFESPRYSYESSSGPRSARGGEPSRAGPNDPPPRPYSPRLAQPSSKFDDRKYQETRVENRPGWRNDRPNDIRPVNNAPPPREYRVRPEDGPRHPLPPPPGPAPVSGTNNVPIGVRRISVSLPPPPIDFPAPKTNGTSVPIPPLPYNPSARPPASTLINPSKARDLPTGKESYERPTLLTSFLPPLPPKPERPARDSHQTSNASSHVPNINRVPEQYTERPKHRRESRFSAREMNDKNVSELKLNDLEDNTVIVPPNAKQPTPPPLSRESSALSFANMSSDEANIPRGRLEEQMTGPQYGRKPESDARIAQTSTAGGTMAETSGSDSSKSAQRRPNSRWGDNSTRRQAAEHPEQSDLSARMSIDPPPSLARRMSHASETESRPGNSLPSPQNEVLSFQNSRPTLLDRLKLPSSETQSQSLRDRIVPSKRDRSDMADNTNPSNGSYDVDDGNDNKRVRRRNVKNRRGGRRNAS